MYDRQVAARDNHGGRGRRAAYETTHVRVPVPLKEIVEAMIANYRNLGYIPEMQTIEPPKPKAPEHWGEISFEELPIIAAIAKPANISKITYRFAPDGSMVLDSIKGINVKELKRMDDKQLENIGLCRGQFGVKTKYFPIDPESC